MSDDLLAKDQFPRASAYHPDWLVASASGGANALWLTEWLTSAMDLKEGMRVLDLGCGRAMSSIFLAREFGVRVWAADLWFSPAENLQRIEDAGVGERVFPLRADARSLPFAEEQFDAIVSIDAYPYFGTDYHYLNYVARFLNPGGVMGIAGVGMMQEMRPPLPEHLKGWWDAEPAMWCIHSAEWWRSHWERTGIVEVEVADNMPGGWQRWLDWHRVVAPDNAVEIAALEADKGENLGYVRAVGRRKDGAVLEDPSFTIPPGYKKKPLLREDSGGDG